VQAFHVDDDFSCLLLLLFCFLFISLHQKHNIEMSLVKIHITINRILHKEDEDKVQETLTKKINKEKIQLQLLQQLLCFNFICIYIYLLNHMITNVLCKTMFVLRLKSRQSC